MKKLLLIILAIFFITSCAGPMTKQVEVSDEHVASEAELQKKLILKNHLKTQIHALKVGIPILIAGKKECEDNLRPLSGLLPASWKTEAPEYQDAFKALYGEEDEMKLFVVPDTFADEAGFKDNDSLLAIDGVKVNTGVQGYKDAIAQFNSAAANEALVEYTIRRDGQRQYISMSSPMACSYPINVATGDDSLNAFADGKQIVITKGMMRFVENDDELALIIGHELAHNNMGHIRAKTTNFWLGTILDVLVAGTTGIDTGSAFGNMAASSNSQEFESEADFVGLYFAARAGYDLENAPDFWRRMAVEHPSSVKGSYLSTHPSSPHRYVFLEETVEEIQNKQIAEEPLDFHMKERATTEGDSQHKNPLMR